MGLRLSRLLVSMALVSIALLLLPFIIVGDTGPGPPHHAFGLFLELNVELPAVSRAIHRMNEIWVARWIVALTTVGLLCLIQLSEQRSERAAAVVIAIDGVAAAWIAIQLGAILAAIIHL